MPEHTHTGRCILVAALTLFGAAAVHATPKESPGKDAGGKDASAAISLDQLGGTWKNVKSGVNVRIEQGAVGWEVWFSTSGEARITLPEKNRPAIKIDGRDFTCSYSVTLPSAETMKWDLTQGQPETQCLTGVFTRLGPAPSEVKRVTPPAPAPQVKPAVKHEPAAVERSAEVRKLRQPEPVIERTPASGRAPTMVRERPMPRHAAVYRRPSARIASRHRGWPIAAAAPSRYASGYWPYRYFRYHYRWYVVLIPRCGCR